MISGTKRGLLELHNMHISNKYLNFRLQINILSYREREREGLKNCDATISL